MVSNAYVMGIEWPIFLVGQIQYWLSVCEDDRVSTVGVRIVKRVVARANF